MPKDFTSWHSKKSQIDEVQQRAFFHQRQIWFCHLGANVGSEQDGRGEDFLRPVVIIRKFNNEIFWGVPLTKARKKLNKNIDRYYFKFSFVDGIQSLAVLSQIRLIDARRLSRHIGTMTKEEFSQLNKKLKDLIP